MGMVHTDSWPLYLLEALDMTGDELKTLRTRHKISRARLAHIMTGKYGRGFSERAVKAWEREENPIPSIKAIALREFLG